MATQGGLQEKEASLSQMDGTLPPSTPTPNPLDSEQPDGKGEEMPAAERGGAGPEYPPLRTVVLVMLGLYIAMFLVSLVCQVYFAF
jgi:hypothetical protein